MANVASAHELTISNRRRTEPEFNRAVKACPVCTHVEARERARRDAIYDKIDRIIAQSFSEYLVTGEEVIEILDDEAEVEYAIDELATGALEQIVVLEQLVEAEAVNPESDWIDALFAEARSESFVVLPAVEDTVAYFKQYELGA